MNKRMYVNKTSMYPDSFGSYHAAVMLLYMELNCACQFHKSLNVVGCAGPNLTNSHLDSKTAWTLKSRCRLVRCLVKA